VTGGWSRCCWCRRLDRCGASLPGGCRDDEEGLGRCGCCRLGATAPPPDPRVQPKVTVANSSLPVGRGQHGLLAIVHSNTGTARPLIISVQLLNLHPGRRYNLIGNSCQGNAPDFVWASGRASKTGSLLLVTFPRDVNPSVRYWLALKRPGGGFMSGVAGAFATGDVSPFRAGHEPCAP
jgi:hypothetical protein